MPESTRIPPPDDALVVLAAGDLVVDTRRSALARVMAVGRTRYTLRPPHGGLEWDAPRDRVRPATASDELAERMRTKGLLTTPQDAR